jgi:hypothetical protein
VNRTQGRRGLRGARRRLHDGARQVLRERRRAAAQRQASLCQHPVSVFGPRATAFLRLTRLKMRRRKRGSYVIV